MKLTSLHLYLSPGCAFFEANIYEIVTLSCYHGDKHTPSRVILQGKLGKKGLFAECIPNEWGFSGGHLHLFYGFPISHKKHKKPYYQFPHQFVQSIALKANFGSFCKH